MAFQFRKEAIEENLNSNFPSQGQGNPPLYYSLSEVVVPTYSINNVAEGSSLPEMLQTAWDFSTGALQITSGTPTNVITNTGFWLVDLSYAGVRNLGSGRESATVDIYDGVTAKQVWGFTNNVSGGLASESIGVLEAKFVVYLRSGDVLRGKCQSTSSTMDIWYRQIADVTGNLVNPLGFSFA